MGIIAIVTPSGPFHHGCLKLHPWITRVKCMFWVCGSGNFSSPLSRKAVRSKRISAIPFGVVIDFSSSSDWQQRRVDGRQLLSVTWQGLQEGLADLHQCGIFHTAKQGFQEAKDRIQSLDARQLSMDFRSSPLSMQGTRLWQNSDPWIKWPSVIL